MTCVRQDENEGGGIWMIRAGAGVGVPGAGSQRRGGVEPGRQGAEEVGTNRIDLYMLP